MVEDDARAAALVPRSSSLRRFGGRVALLYATLYAAPFPLTLVPWLDAEAAWRGFEVPLVTAFAERGLGLAVPAFPNGSGDTTWNHVELLLFALVAAAGAALWTVIARGSGDGRMRALLLRTELRFVLSSALLSYGVAKIAPLQFAPLSDDQLSTTYGDSSPMGLLWSFMAFSRPYQMFVGAVEAAAGLLLLARTTAPLGALLGLAAMGNVVALDLCFDVPVKLYSLHLFAMAAAIALPDAGRLIAAACGRAVAPGGAAHALAPRSPAARRAWLVIELALAVGTVAVQVGQTRAAFAFEEESGTASIAGLWIVPAPGGDAPPGGERVGRSAAEDDVSSWLRVDIAPFGVVTVRRRDRSSDRYQAECDEMGRRLTLFKFGQRRVAPWPLDWEHPSPDRLRLSSADPPWTAELERAAPRTFALTRGGFRWIQESPDRD